MKLIISSANEEALRHWCALLSLVGYPSYHQPVVVTAADTGSPIQQQQQQQQSDPRRAAIRSWCRTSQQKQQIGNDGHTKIEEAA